jgi:hypothetical protein
MLAVHHVSFDGACNEDSATIGDSQIGLASGHEQVVALQQSDDDATKPNASPSTVWRSEGRTRKAGDCRLRSKALLLVVIWSLAEVPFEIATAANSDEKLAVVCSKVIVSVIALLAERQVRWAEFIFMFICGSSILAIVPGLADEMKISWSVFGWSFGECAIKTFAMLAFARSSGQPDGA